LIGALYRCYPRPIGQEALLDLLPGRDHVEDRQPKLVASKVCHLRRKLGADAIEFVPGLGYRLGSKQHGAMRPYEPSVELRLAS
jgi:DNA-binding response OmpR family regulator